MSALTISDAEVKRVKGFGFLNNKGTDNFSARIITVNGKVSAKQLACVAEAAAAFATGDVTFTSRLTMEVQGVPFDKIEAFRAFIAREGLETGGTGPRVRPVVCCKGTTCQYGQIDTFGLAEKIHQRFYVGYYSVLLPHKFKIAVGGCPNNCVKPDLNDLGVIGQRIPNYDASLCKGCVQCSVDTACPMGVAKVVDGRLSIDTAACNNCGRCVGTCRFDAIPSGTQGYKIYLGGFWGKWINHGKPLSTVFLSEEETLRTIEKAILFYREQGRTGERFGMVVNRIGFDTVQRELLSDAILARKQTILGAQQPTAGGATC